VVDRVKGGLVVDIGVRGFVPATHVGNGKLRNIEKFVGETLPVKIIEVDRERRKVVLSNRVAEEEKREEIKEDLFSSATPGDIMSGTVRRLTDYGAFVDLGGIDGLLHISEMSWVRIDHPKEVLKEGEDIKVMILRLDPDNGRISLGLRQVLPDPWETIRENYKTGQKIKVNVSRMVQSGAFVKLPEGAEAFLPLSEMSNKRIKKPQDVLEENQEIEPTILDLKPDERRMVLSIREGGSREAYDPFSQRNKRGGGRRRREEPAKADERMTPSGGATIGERLGMLKGILKGGEGESSEEQAPAETESTEEKPKETKAQEEKPKEEATKEEKSEPQSDEETKETKE
jgi:ribosomal protein S1